MNQFTGESSIGRWVSRLNRHAQAYISRELKPYNIGSGQYIFLLVLYLKNGVNQETLAEILNMDKATTARALTKLEREGYVKRIADTKDKRAWQVHLTEKALSVMPLIKKAMKEWNDIVTTGMEEDERETALRLLEKMAANASYTRHNCFR